MKTQLNTCIIWIIPKYTGYAANLFCLIVISSTGDLSPLEAERELEEGRRREKERRDRRERERREKRERERKGEREREEKRREEKRREEERREEKRREEKRREEKTREDKRREEKRREEKRREEKRRDGDADGDGGRRLLSEAKGQVSGARYREPGASCRRQNQ